MKKELKKIVIKKGLRVGDLEAETDKKLLLQCFVDNGDLDLLLDVNQPESIVVGRTGSGKSALLLKIQHNAYKSKILDPNDISIRFLEHSDIIQFFSNLGVKLDLFYRLLWRHILTVELLKLRYDIKSENDSKGILTTLGELIGVNTPKGRALAYFKEWGSKFWLDTEQQLREVTKKLGCDLKAGFGAKLQDIEISLDGAKNLSEERRSEIIHKANKVVSGIQIKSLSLILDMLDESVFKDKQKKYYILIDKLDEDWANSETRFRFIRALIEEIKTFRKVSNIKIVIALRKDLIDTVFDETRDAGFQEEKYESYMLQLIWSKKTLAKLIDIRINTIFKHQYTTSNINFIDIFPSPKKGGGAKAIDYILDRTLLRPRDVMQFINECLVISFGNSAVSWRDIFKAESSYSNKRLNSLLEEWEQIYPNLKNTIEVIRSIPFKFSRSDLKERINLSHFPVNDNDPCSKVMTDYINDSSQVKETDVIAIYLNCLYRIGAVGIKISSTEPYHWSNYDNSMLSLGEIKRVNQIKVHKMLVRALGIKVDNKN